MRNIFLILFASILFVGCEDSNISLGRKLWKAYLKNNMRDPSSLVIHNESYEKKGHKIKWTIDYGGRNGFGGMSRETLECETIHEHLFIEGGGSYTKKSLGL